MISLHVTVENEKYNKIKYNLEQGMSINKK